MFRMPLSLTSHAAYAASPLGKCRYLVSLRSMFHACNTLARAGTLVTLETVTEQSGATKMREDTRRRGTEREESSVTGFSAFSEFVRSRKT